MDVDPTYMKAFKCLVCKNCQNEKPEKYSLLTKTECKQVRYACIPFRAAKLTCTRTIC